MPKLIFTKPYEKKEAKFLKKHPDVRTQYYKTLELLELNPSHPSLKLHQLSGDLSGIYSASINISNRITMEFYIKDDKVVPLNVGTHDEVYR